MSSPTSDNPKTVPEAEELGIEAGKESGTQDGKESEGQLEISSGIDLAPMNNLLYAVNGNSKNCHLRRDMSIQH